MVMMDVDSTDLRPERSGEMREQDDSPGRERWGEDGLDALEENDLEKSRDSSKHQSKSSGRKEEKEHRSKNRERLREGEKEDKSLQKDRVSSRDRRKDDRDDTEKDKTRDRAREKDTDRDKYRDKERDRGREKDRRYHDKEKERDKDDLERDGGRGRDKERAKDKSRDKDKDKERTKDREREREKEKDREKQREREREYDRVRSKDASDKEKVKQRTREEWDVVRGKEKSRDTDGSHWKLQDGGHNRSMHVGNDDMSRFNEEDGIDGDLSEPEMGLADAEDTRISLVKGESIGSQPAVSELEERILKMKEERLKKKPEGASEVLSWVNKSRQIEEKRKAEKEKALQLSKIFEEQDRIDQEESDDEEATRRTTEELSGAKILHGLDKVLEGGSVVLTLKDQSILSGDDVNQEVDVLENVEIGEQKRRDDAYKAAKKKTGIYDQSDEFDSEKKMLPQYDDPMEEEGVTLDGTGRFSGGAEKKLEELRRRIQGVATKNHTEDLNSSSKILTDYYTQEEMLQFKKPKKKKSLRKKEKLDIDALEAEAISTGLGAGDLGTRNDKTRQALKEEKERAEAEMRSKAYQTAYTKAQEASKALRPEQAITTKAEEDDAVFDDDDEELRKSLERARKLALKKQEAGKSVPEAIALLATSNANNSTVDNNSNPAIGDSQENKVVFTEMEEFVWGLQLDEDAKKPDAEDVFMEDVTPNSPEAAITEDGGWTEVKETENNEPATEEDEEAAPDGAIHEAAVGKGLSGALRLLKERGTLKETIEWGGRNMDKKKSKLVGIIDEEGPKEIHIERTDEYGRILTPKEAFRLLSHKFHGKGPGKMKQEKRMRQYQEELKVKQMKNSDTPSQSVERMREAQEKLKTPYLILSGHVKPGQTSDPRSGFATVEKDLPGGLTPMLGDKKVEHFLGIKRKPEPGDSNSQKKPRT
nr:SART-1 family protein DOT2 isoform X1 [Ipomoea trifida]